MIYFIFLITLLAPIFSAQAATSNELFQNAKPSLFRVFSSISQTTPKSSYGTGFVVNAKEGLLVTNYHVVSSYFTDIKQQYKIFVEIEKERKEAQILDISINHDLALLKVKHRFPYQLSIRLDEPALGSKIYSLGLPNDLNMSITEGIYNGKLDQSIEGNIQMSNPINSGMSGGPTIDEHGQVIGVNVSYLIGSNNLSFAVAKEHLLSLLTRSRQESKELKYSTILNRDIEAYQTKLRTSLKEEQLKSEELRNWKFRIPDKIMKCWADVRDTDNNNSRVFFHQCSLSDAIFIDRDYYAGQINFATMIPEKKYSSPIWYNTILNSYFTNKTLLEHSLVDFLNREKTEKVSEQCSQSITVNKHNIAFKLNWCIKAPVQFAPLAEISWRGASMGQDEERIIFSGRAKGFKEDLLKDLMLFQIDHIQKAGSL